MTAGGPLRRGAAALAAVLVAACAPNHRFLTDDVDPDQIALPYLVRRVDVRDVRDQVDARRGRRGRLKDGAKTTAHPPLTTSDEHTVAAAVRRSFASGPTEVDVVASVFTGAQTFVGGDRGTLSAASAKVFIDVVESGNRAAVFHSETDAVSRVEGHVGTARDADALFQKALRAAVYGALMSAAGDRPPVH